jgi:hypothetical protein
MKKQLRLARITIAHLTTLQLEHAVGGVQTGETLAGQQSMKIGTVVEPCELGPGGRTRDRTSTMTP